MQNKINQYEDKISITCTKRRKYVKAYYWQTVTTAL